MVGYMSETSSVIIRTSGSVGRITLNRPEALHALTEEMCLAMYEALKSWEMTTVLGSYWLTMHAIRAASARVVIFA